MSEMQLNIGEPVQSLKDPNQVGKIVAIFHPCCGSEDSLHITYVAVRPAGRKYMIRLYDPWELRLCTCAHQNV